MSEKVMADEIERQVIEIIAEQAMLQPSEVKMSSTPADLGLDSLAMVEIVFAIEEQFDVSVPFNANAPDSSDFDISTVGGTIEGVRRLTASKG